MYLGIRIILLIFLILNSIICIVSEFKLTILHTNDMHSRIQETSRTTGTCKPPEPCYGGFARLAHEVKRIKSSIPNTLFLNAGDTYQGTPLYSFFKWHVVLPFIHMLGIDVMSLGNHEFDDGVSGLAPYLKEVKIPVVTCNLNTSKAPALENTALKKWHMLTVEDVKIAVIGYLTPDTKFLSSAGNVTFFDEIKMIEKYAREAKAEGANLIFALGHSGYTKDKEIAEKVAEVDLVVGGHTDTFLYTGTPPDIEKPAAEYPLLVSHNSGKKVPVVQAYGYTKYLGKLDLIWDDKFELVSATGNPILMDSHVPKDQDVENEVQIWGSKLIDTMNVTMGTSKVFLDGKCRFKECNFGNFIADALVNHVAQQYAGNKWTEAPISIYNSGAIRASIELAENVKWADLITVLPFGNQLVRLKMKGHTLLKALSRSVENYDFTGAEGHGGFLQFSGLKVKYVKRLNQTVGVDAAYARCGNCNVPKYEQVDPQKNYTVITTMFVADGGDGYYMLKSDAIREQVYDEVDLDIVGKYLKKLSPIYPGEEGRITFSEEIVEASKLQRNTNGGTIFTQFSCYLLFACFLFVINS